MTSWWPLMCSRYQGTLKSWRSTRGASSRSARRSKSGTTRSRRPSAPPHSRCSRTTERTSEAQVLIEMTYAPSESPSATISAHTLNVSSASATSGLLGRSWLMSGRLPPSSLVSHSIFCSSGQDL